MTLIQFQTEQGFNVMKKKKSSKPEERTEQSVSVMCLNGSLHQAHVNIHYFSG